MAGPELSFIIIWRFDWVSNIGGGGGGGGGLEPPQPPPSSCAPVRYIPLVQRNRKAAQIYHTAEKENTLLVQH